MGDLFGGFSKKGKKNNSEDDLDDYEDNFDIDGEESLGTDFGEQGDYGKNYQADSDLGMPTSFSDDNIKFLQDNKPIIAQIIFNLQGKFLTKSGQYKRLSGLKPIMNDIGVIRVYRKLNTLLTQIVSLGNIDVGEARRRTQSIIEPFIEEIAQNKDEWQVRLEDMSSVIAEIEAVIFLHLTRPIARGEAKLLKGIYSQHENVTNTHKKTFNL